MKDCLQCPQCNVFHGTRTGNQPKDGRMRVELISGGGSYVFPSKDMIRITYE